MGKWDTSCVDKNEFALKMWDETPEGMDISVCFKSQSEAKHAVKLWNIHHKREYTMVASSPTTWAVRCRTLNVPSEDGDPPCVWKMRVSLKDHGLHEIVWAYEWIERIAPQRVQLDYILDETAPLAQWEPHESLRAVRQFGYIQGVSRGPMIKDRAAFLLDHAHSMSGLLSNNCVDHHSAVRPHWRKREKYVLKDLEVGFPGKRYEGYYEWFMMNTVKLISNPKNYEAKGYETSSSRVKLYGEVLNNIRVSSKQFRDDRDEKNLLNNELEEYLNKIINQTHAALTLGPNDEIDMDDTQILVDEESSLPSQPAPRKKAKPWPRDKIGGGRKRKIEIPPRSLREQNDSDGSRNQQREARRLLLEARTSSSRLNLKTMVDLRLNLVESRNHSRESYFSLWQSPNPYPNPNFINNMVQYSCIFGGKIGFTTSQINTLRMRLRKEKGKNEPLMLLNKKKPVFVVTNFGTRVVVAVSPECTVGHFKEEFENAHFNCFPEHGKVTVDAVKIRRKSCSFDLAELFPLKYAFEGAKCWFLYVVSHRVENLSAYKKNGRMSKRKRCKKRKKFWCFKAMIFKVPRAIYFLKRTKNKPQRKRKRRRLEDRIKGSEQGPLKSEENRFLVLESIGDVDIQPNLGTEKECHSEAFSERVSISGIINRYFSSCDEVNSNSRYSLMGSVEQIKAIGDFDYQSIQSPIVPRTPEQGHSEIHQGPNSRSLEKKARTDVGVRVVKASRSFGLSTSRKSVVHSLSNFIDGGSMVTGSGSTHVRRLVFEIPDTDD
ncbi:OLC1v1018573C1 [Oldenlandia corymbosa var. corymbosa]|uniref:OLC1v1018573C1 n=1 Tax=Oldenlandia corymbosa var. corymbosa TaxID=529605 RepID=A0AAV1EBX3_OLDCO|nr:OLC1v1018573C1 [Oldenlandia corymbosa var. corymbosa]